MPVASQHLDQRHPITSQPQALERLAAALADRYRIERELGRGGMATVYLADDLRHDRKVAIKLLRPELAGAIGVDRFVREIRLTAQLQHPGIVTVFDSGVLPGPGTIELPWYAMPYIAGESLRARLERDGQLPVEDALRITEEAAAAVHAAHRQGVVHRDIKPENLLLADGRTHVADFGIAKALLETGGDRLTSTGLAIGTPAYMSPEQASAEKVDARTDQYSLASVLYEMLLGEPPFTGPTAQALVARRMAEPARPLRPVRSSVPEAVEAALLRALERVPADRFPDVAAFVAALRGTAVPIRARPRRRISAALLGGGGALLLGIALAGWLLAGRPAHTGPVRDSVAVALYQRGVQSYDRRTAAGASDAIQSFTAAIRRDSSYAQAWSGLARVFVRAYGRGFGFQGVARDSVLRLAVIAAERAFALDRRDADVWVTRGLVGRLVDPTDLTPVFASLRQALAIDSTSAVAWMYLALSLAESGDLGAALTAWRRSVSLDPSYAEAVAFTALGHYWQRRHDSASYWADSAIAVDPTYLLARQAAGIVAIERGDFARARSAYQTLKRLSTDAELVNALAGAAQVEARSGNATAARVILQRAESLATAYVPIPLHTVTWLAEAYAALAEPDRSIEWLHRYSPREDLHFQLHLRCGAAFDPLTTDQRFQALLQSVDIPRSAC